MRWRYKWATDSAPPCVCCGGGGDVVHHVYQQTESVVVSVCHVCERTVPGGVGRGEAQGVEGVAAQGIDQGADRGLRGGLFDVRVCIR